jgi:hypothetical protein
MYRKHLALIPSGIIAGRNSLNRPVLSSTTPPKNAGEK